MYTYSLDTGGEVSTRQSKRAAAMGGGDDFATTRAQLLQGGILPARLAFPIQDEKVEDTRALSSAGHLSMLEERGDTIEQIALNYYRENTYVGTPRKSDNSDFLRGKEPLYDDLNHCLAVYRSVSSVVEEMVKLYSPKEESDLWASMEMQDANKVTAQQWKYPGWFLQSPITSANVPDPLPAKALLTLDKVAWRYGKVLKEIGLAGKSARELTLMDSDPQDTMTGMPTLQAGDMTHAARLAALAAYPPPQGDPKAWLARVDELAATLGFPDATFYSPVTSTRFGPLKKPLPVWRWLGPGMGYEADGMVSGAYNRVRFVFPAPYPINFLLSPIYEQMSHVRQNMLGFWHDPEHQARYLEVLRKQGRFPYSADFSGMDTALFPHIIAAVLDALKRNGFCPFPLDAFKLVIAKSGIILPDYTGQPGSATFLRGPARPWASGYKVTSEFDTIYGASVVLSSLEEQFPGITDKWINGQFTFLELGDDVFFTSPTEIDSAKFSDAALRNWGAKLEVIRDCMFLKWFLPVVPEIPHLTRSFSRFIQQTFYNEDRYSGISGGERPPAVLRLGLTARLKGLTTHRDWAIWWPKVLPIVRTLKYVVQSPEFSHSLESGAPTLSDQDVRDIYAYSLKRPDYLINLRERAKYEPSAATLLQILEEKGIQVGQTPAEVAIREEYWNAFSREPTAEDVERLRSLTDPVIQARY